MRFAALIGGMMFAAASVAAAAPNVVVTNVDLDVHAVMRNISPVSGWSKRIPTVVSLPGPQSRIEYAKACAIDIGDIPALHCMDGEIIPITVKGKAVFAPVPNEACDRPVKLPNGDNQCMPFTRLLDLSPTNRPEVTVMAICRKYHASTGVNDSTFHDLAIVAHNRKNGATCFFQSEPGQAVDGKLVPSPMENSLAADAVWLKPSADTQGVVSYVAPGGIACTNCHDADPFILSPWIKQVAKLEKWDPNGKYLVDRHGVFSDVAGRPWATRTNGTAPARQLEGCNGCHRIGGASLHRIGSEPGGLTFNNHANFHGFMPLGNSDTPADWAKSFDSVLASYEACLSPPNGKPAAGCDVVRAGTHK